MTGQSSGRQAAVGVARRTGRGRPPDAGPGAAASGETARRSAIQMLAPQTVSWFSVGFAVIAAVWLTLGSARANWVALAALLAAYYAARAGRTMAGQAPQAVVAWPVVACALLSEFIVYAGMAAAVTLHPVTGAPHGPAAGAIRGTFVADLGGPGAGGVWRLAVMAVILAALLPMAEVCLRGSPRRGAQPGTRSVPGAARRSFGAPGDVRLPLAGAVVLLAGERAALVALLVLGVAAFGAMIIDGTRAGRFPGERRGYRGDGWLAVRIGGFVDGRLPPLPPLLAGVLVTGVLAALGLRNLPGILVLTPVEAMLLAALGSWHPHDGRGDWRVPPLLQAAEYVFIAEAGFAGGLWAPVTFALIAAIGLRHLDLAYRACGRLASGVDRLGLGWEGRMIVVGIAAAAGIQPVIYPMLALYLWWLNARDWAVGWSARHATVNR